MSAPYLHELTLRLALGATAIEQNILKKHVSWLQAKQSENGGYAGREGDCDPYYSAFALRALWVAGALDGDIAKRAGSFLRARLNERESMIDMISLIFGAAICEMAAGEVVLPDEEDQQQVSWRSNVSALLESLRTPDGGYAKTPEGRAGSTYQTFLTVLCYQLIEVPVPDIDSIVAFLKNQQHAEGGFLEIRAAKRAGVNPTAAAIGTLKALGRLKPEEHRKTIEFLADMQSDEGGFTANTRIPFADLLSTFTGTLTLFDLEAINEINLNAVQKYAQSMQGPEGGFFGFALDQTADVEYSFYGIGTLALCHT
ncbi:MAG: prenyltransferase/squalene oxidase repeat-containing protein [Planctomycetota bacterium]|nr:prenyltransferase/squalene oxidase repeat-containing protein [Planctomycetota bacterium]